MLRLLTNWARSSVKSPSLTACACSVCAGGYAYMPIEKFVGADSKEFELPDGGVVRIWLHETVDLATCMQRGEGNPRAHEQAS